MLSNTRLDKAKHFPLLVITFYVFLSAQSICDQNCSFVIGEIPDKITAVDIEEYVVAGNEWTFLGSKRHVVRSFDGYRRAFFSNLSEKFQMLSKLYPVGNETAAPLLVPTGTGKDVLLVPKDTPDSRYTLCFQQLKLKSRGKKAPSNSAFSFSSSSLGSGQFYMKLDCRFHLVLWDNKQNEPVVNRNIRVKIMQPGSMVDGAFWDQCFEKLVSDFLRKTPFELKKLDRNEIRALEEM